MKEKKQFSIFEFIKSIIDTKQDWKYFTPEQQKIFNGFMVNKFLSMNPKYIEIVNYIQSLNIQNNQKLYEVYCFMIPKSKQTYSPYIKSNTKKPNEDVLKYVSKHFECSLKEAEEYIGLTDEKWLENILSTGGVEEKIIKKLIKNG